MSVQSHVGVLILISRDVHKFMSFSEQNEVSFYCFTCTKTLKREMNIEVDWVAQLKLPAEFLFLNRLNNLICFLLPCWTWPRIELLKGQVEKKNVRRKTPSNNPLRQP